MGNSLQDAIFCNLFDTKGLSLQVFPRPRRRPPLKSLSAASYRQFNCASEDLESSPMLIMAPTCSSERNKQTLLISDLNNRRSIVKSVSWLKKPLMCLVSK